MGTILIQHYMELKQFIKINFYSKAILILILIIKQFFFIKNVSTTHPFLGVNISLDEEQWAWERIKLINQLSLVHLYQVFKNLIPEREYSLLNTVLKTEQLSCSSPNRNLLYYIKEKIRYILITVAASGIPLHKVTHKYLPRV